MNAPLRALSLNLHPQWTARKGNGRLLTHVNGTREGLTLSQDSETIAQVCHVVFSLNFVSVEWFVTLIRPENISYRHYNFDIVHTWRVWAWSYFETENAVVFLSTVFKTLEIMPGEPRVWEREKFPYWRQQTWQGLADWGEVGGEAKEKENWWRYLQRRW